MDRDPDADKLNLAFERVYDELKRQARASLRRLPHGQTLTPTALVSEAYVKLCQANKLDLEGNRHFFALAARAMRQIIVDQARATQTTKRGGDLQAVTLDKADISIARTADELLDLEQAMNDLEKMAPRQRELVELKFFAGLSVEEIATLMEMSPRTAWREWDRARSYLHARLQRQ